MHYPGLIPQLAGKNDSIISDQLNHGSIIDGVRLSGVKKENRTIYAHNDMGELEDRLKEATKKSEKTLVHNYYRLRSFPRQHIHSMHFA